MATFPIRYSQAVPSGEGPSVPLRINTDTGIGDVYGALANAGGKIADYGLKLQAAEEHVKTSAEKVAMDEAADAYLNTLRTTTDPQALDDLTKGFEADLAGKATTDRSREYMAALRGNVRGTALKFQTDRKLAEVSDGFKLTLPKLYARGDADGAKQLIGGAVAQGILTQAEGVDHIENMPFDIALAMAANADPEDAIAKLGALTPSTPERTRQRDAMVAHKREQLNLAKRQSAFDDDAADSELTASAISLIGKSPAKIAAGVAAIRQNPVMAKMSGAKQRALSGFLDSIDKPETSKPDAEIEAEAWKRAINNDPTAVQYAKDNIGKMSRESFVGVTKHVATESANAVKDAAAAEFAALELDGSVMGAKESAAFMKQMVPLIDAMDPKNKTPENVTKLIRSHGEAWFNARFNERAENLGEAEAKVYGRVARRAIPVTTPDPENPLKTIEADAPNPDWKQARNYLRDQRGPNWAESRTAVETLLTAFPDAELTAKEKQDAKAWGYGRRKSPLDAKESARLYGRVTSGASAASQPSDKRPGTPAAAAGAATTKAAKGNAVGLAGGAEARAEGGARADAGKSSIPITSEQIINLTPSSLAGALERFKGAGDPRGERDIAAPLSFGERAALQAARGLLGKPSELARMGQGISPTRTAIESYRPLYDAYRASDPEGLTTFAVFAENGLPMSPLGYTKTWQDPELAMMAYHWAKENPNLDQREKDDLIALIQASEGYGQAYRMANREAAIGPELRAPASAGEKVADVAGGLVPLIAEMLVVKKLVSPAFGKTLAGKTMPELIAWSATSEDPMIGAALGATLGAINMVKGGKIVEAAKILAEGGVFGGVAAAQGADSTDIIIQALMPAAMRSTRLLGVWRDRFAKAKTPAEQADVLTRLAKAGGEQEVNVLTIKGSGGKHTTLVAGIDIRAATALARGTEATYAAEKVVEAEAEAAKKAASKKPSPIEAAGAAGEAGSPMRLLGAPREKLPTRETTKPRIEPSPIAGGKARPAGEIILDLSDAVGKPISKGPPGRGLAGVYGPRQAKTVVRFAGDLDTTAHEVAHALDDAFGIVGDWARPRVRSPYDAELADFWWHGSSRKSGPRAKLAYKRGEGVAEYLRAWMVNPDATEAQAPKFTAFIKGKMNEKAWKALRDFSQKTREFAGAPAVEQAAANIRMGTKPGLAKDVAEALGNGLSGIRRATKNAGEWLANAITDRLYSVDKAIKTAKELTGKTPGPSKDPAVLIRTLAGDSVAYGNMVLKGPIDLKAEAEGRVARAKDVGGIDWMVETLDGSSKKALETDLRDLNVLLTSQKAIEHGGKLYRELGDKIAEIDKAVAEGRMDPEKAAKAKSRLESATKNRADRVAGFGAGLFSDQAVAAKALSELKANPERFARLGEAARRYRDFADANLKMLVDSGRITQAKYDAIVGDNQFYANMGRVMDDVLGPVRGTGGKALGTKAETVQARVGSTRQIADPMLNMVDQGYKMYHEARRNMAMRGIVDLMDTARKMYEGKPLDIAQIGYKTTASDAQAITVFRDGKPEYWRFEAKIHEALKQWGNTPMRGPLYKVLTALPRLLRSSVIHSPAFAARNVIRDTFQRVVISNRAHPLTTLGHKADVAGFTSKDLLELSGGSAGGHYQTNQRQYYKVQRRALDELTKRNVLVAGAKDIGKLYLDTLESSETFGRVREFNAAFTEAKNRGMSDADATAFAGGEARGLMDFAKGGNIIKAINDFVPFTNAAVQGLTRTIGAFAKHPARSLARWGVYILAPTLAEYAINVAAGDEEEYRALPPWQRDMFWNFKIGHRWVSIPKPWELGTLASGVTRAIDKARGNKDAFYGYGGSVAKSMLPLDESAIAGPGAAVVESLANYDFFRGKTIVPQYEKPLDVENRAGAKHASSLAHVLAKVIPTDPRYLDHMIQSQFGGLGSSATRLSDVAKGRFSPLKETGLVRDVPATASIPVKKLEETLRESGISQYRQFKPFKAALEAFYKAKTTEERDAAAKRLREIAKTSLPIAERLSKLGILKLQRKVSQEE